MSDTLGYTVEQRRVSEQLLEIEGSKIGGGSVEVSFCFFGVLT